MKKKCPTLRKTIKMPNKAEEATFITFEFNPLDPMYRSIGIFVKSYIPKYQYIVMKLTISGLNIV